ncbi:hypothetical protein FEM03_01860 [Phragmitibacter flavus]|uniref:DUF481 domain-containing protein n=1 Tax=Phragmitibacter flavus TaxID=2576071 RepID=A0A5R8KKL6_9BACT|nr:hypothetical protein [Phragmitibacter flavus]TLD72842.1 hypothetical protein FEM03_01860 [Phragmitibacter flavus]
MKIISQHHRLVMLQARLVIGLVVMAMVLAISHKAGNAQEISPASRISQEVSAARLQSVPDARRSVDARVGRGWISSETDIGEQQVVVIKEDLAQVTMGLSTGMLYTSNAGLTPVNEQQDWIWNTGVYAAWTPRITNRFYLSLGARQDFYRYQKFDEVLDFDSLRFNASLSYLVPKVDGLLLSVTYGLQRTTPSLNWSESLFRSHTIVVGVQKAFRFSRGNQLVASYASEFSINTEPSLLTRYEHVLQLAHQIRWTPKFDTTLAYRGAYNDYREIEGLSAWNHTVALMANYAFTDWLSLTANISYLWNQADDANFDYDMNSIGASLNVTAKF